MNKIKPIWKYSLGSFSDDNTKHIIALDKYKEFAIIVKASKITFSSSRKGWLKRSKTLGFELESFSVESYHFSKRLIV